MVDKMIIENKLRAARQRWDTLTAKIEPVQQQLDLETRVDEKLRLSNLIQIDDAERSNIENEIRQLESELLLFQSKDMVSEALRLEQNRAFLQAREIWERIIELNADDERALRQVERLNAAVEHEQTVSGLKQQISKRIKDITTTFGSVIKALNNSSPADQPMLAVVESFLSNDISAEEFVLVWNSLHESNSTSSASIDFGAFSRRINQGGIVFFLGSDIAFNSGMDVLNAASMAADLAKRVNLESDEASLSAVAEYYQIRPEYGRLSFESLLSEFLPKAPLVPALYGFLRQIEQPLVIISAAYDTLLESAFKEVGKKFAILTSYFDGAGEQSAGKILIEKSDQDNSEDPCLEQEVSSFSLLEQGYSLIFKIRGYCSDEVEKIERPGLTLSEGNYFNFARHFDKTIPSYIAKQLNAKGLVIIGHSPSSWEDRLIISAILDRRRNTVEPAYYIGSKGNRFATAFWESRNVYEQELELNEFVERMKDVQ